MRNLSMSPFPHEDPEQLYRIHRVQFEDGSTRDFPMALVGQSDVQDQAVWLSFEHLFSGTMPGYPKAVSVVAVWTGRKGSDPNGGS